MLTVACVLSGGEYDWSHVLRLRAMVHRHLDQPYEFVCIKDSPFSGFWAKLSLFEPGRFQGRVLYFDLDVTIKGRLDDLADYAAPFVIVKDWFQFGFNSSVIAWDADVADHVFTEFDYVRDAPNFKGGDQSWITHKMPGADKFPKAWVQSFKNACLHGGFEPYLRVIAFHGWPRPWELTDLY